MTHARSSRSVAAVAALVLLACSVACSSSGGSGAGAVAASPLRGTVSGAEFVGMSAYARKSVSKPEKRSIEIFDKVVPCGGGVAGPPRYILIVAPWQAGYGADFSFGGDGQLGSFVVDKSGTTTIVVSATGRIEVIDAPVEKGAKGKIRLRMSEQEHSVEGEIAVDVCE
jgi:hypothetical protein